MDRQSPTQTGRDTDCASPARPAKSPEAPFARIKQFLRQGLVSGRWPAGSRMPSEPDLVRRFKVSRMTVNRAFRELLAEGLVQRIRGAGTFAAGLQRVSSTLTIRDIQEEIEARGHHHHAMVCVRQTERASADLAAQLGLAQGAEVFHTRIVHFENDRPLQCEDRYVNPVCAPGYLEADFAQLTPTQYLFRHTSLVRAEYAIESAMASAQEAALLGIAPEAPCLIMTRRTFSREAVITLARLVHPGDRYQLSGDFTL